jgi:hypothetical protein
MIVEAEILEDWETEQQSDSSAIVESQTLEKLDR